eukprot:gene760-biopygen6716
MLIPHKAPVLSGPEYYQEPGSSRSPARFAHHCCVLQSSVEFDAEMLAQPASQPFTEAAAGPTASPGQRQFLLSSKTFRHCPVPGFSDPARCPIQHGKVIQPVFDWSLYSQTRLRQRERQGRAGAGACPAVGAVRFEKQGRGAGRRVTATLCGAHTSTSTPRGQAHQFMVGSGGEVADGGGGASAVAASHSATSVA